MGLFSLFEDVVFNPLVDNNAPKPKKYSKVAEKVKGKINTDRFRKDEDTKYPGGGARDIPWKSKNPDLKMKAIHGFTRDAEALDQLWDWLYDYEKIVLEKMDDKERKKYYEISGYYADYDLSDY